MKTTTTSITAGVIVMSMGGLLLLDELDLLRSGEYIPPLAFTAVGAVFLGLFFKQRENWWAAIPGSVFLGLAATMAASQRATGVAAGTMLFAFMACGFGAVYVRERAHWWALIPGGVMLVLAVVVALPKEWQGLPAATIFMLGLAATFALLSTVRVHVDGRTERMKWPLIPAAVLGVLGGILAFQSAELFIAGDFAAVTLVLLAGAGLLLYGYRAGSTDRTRARGL